jgi:uncharacterized membrane protein
MKWNRADLKRRGRTAFFENYLHCVLVALAMAVITIWLQWRLSRSVFHLFSIFRYLSLTAVFMVAFGAFVLPVVRVCGCRFFLKNIHDEITIEDAANDALQVYKSGDYARIIKTELFRAGYVYLWGLLLVIPGMIKRYEYYLVTYLLADFPDITTEEALRISQEMMEGNKWEAFILDLSFTGWKVAGMATLSLAGIFFTNPYENATKAELYLVLKKRYFGR